MVNKEEMIDTFEELYSAAKMEILSNGEPAIMRQLFGQVQGFFIAMQMALPLTMEEIEYVEDRLHRMEERLPL